MTVSSGSLSLLQHSMPERLYRLSGMERDSGEHIANVTRSSRGTSGQEDKKRRGPFSILVFWWLTIVMTLIREAFKKLNLIPWGGTVGRLR